MDAVKCEAPAKINLHLEILGKRVDGYHDLLTIFQALELSDLISVSLLDEDRIQVLSSVDNIPKDETNLAFKAARNYLEYAGLNQGVSIEISKEIPVAAGLGGGSSDAAAVLKNLNQLFQNRLSKEELFELALAVGSDVPFFLVGGTALGEGRGELLTPFRFIGKIPVLLINPGIIVSTEYVFRKLKESLTTEKSQPNIRSAFSEDFGFSIWSCKAIQNDLEKVVFKEFPMVKAIKEWLRDHGADLVSVSGSGGTVFGLFRDFVKAETVAKLAERQFFWSKLTSTRDRL